MGDLSTGELEEAFKTFDASIERQIETFSKKADSARNTYRVLRYGVILLGVLIPVCLGWPEASPETRLWLHRIAFVLGCAMAGLTAYESEFNYRRTWLSFRMVANRLKAIRYKAVAAVRLKSATVVLLESLDSEFSAALIDANGEWYSLRDRKVDRADGQPG